MNTPPYVISCCSTADLTREHLDRRGIPYVCFHFSLDGVEYPDDLGASMPYGDFYAAMAAGAQTKTSQVNIDEFINFFTPFLRQGLDILHVCLSSGISGVYGSAAIARDMLLEEYPQRKILLVDSLGASSGYGLLVDALAGLRDSGMDIDEVHRWAEANKLLLHHWFFSTDLSFYVKGGRITKVAGWVGTALKLCPLLNMDTQGKLIPREKHRGKQRVIQAMVDKMVRHARGGTAYSGKCYISNSNCPEDAAAVAAAVQARFPDLDGQVEIFSVGTTIGSHTGPGTVALFFWGDHRVD